MDAGKKQSLLELADSLDAISEKLEAAGASAYCSRIDEISNNLRTHASAGDATEALSELLFNSMKHTLNSQLKSPLITADLLDKAVENAHVKLVEAITSKSL